MDTETITKIQIESISDPIIRYIRCMQTYKALVSELNKYLDLGYRHYTKPLDKYRTRDEFEVKITQLKDSLEGLGDATVYNSLMDEKRLRYMVNIQPQYVNIEEIEQLLWDCDGANTVKELSNDNLGIALYDESFFEKSKTFQLDNVRLLMDCAQIIIDTCSGIKASLTKDDNFIDKETFAIFNTVRRKGIMDIAAQDTKHSLITIDPKTGKYIWHGKNFRALTYLMGNLYCGDHIVNDCIVFGDKFPLKMNERFRKYWGVDYDFSGNRRQMKITSSTKDPEFGIVNSWILKYDKG